MSFIGRGMFRGALGSPPQESKFYMFSYKTKPENSLRTPMDFPKNKVKFAPPPKPILDMPLVIRVNMSFQNECESQQWQSYQGMNISYQSDRE